jgi:hypothetical protein
MVTDQGLMPPDSAIESQGVLLGAGGGAIVAPAGEKVGLHVPRLSLSQNIQKIMLAGGPFHGRGELWDRPMGEMASENRAAIFCMFWGSPGPTLLSTMRLPSSNGEILGGKTA